MTTGATPYPISPELGWLLALRRVRCGHVGLVGHDLLIDRECRFPDYLRESVRELLGFRAATTFADGVAAFATDPLRPPAVSGTR